MRNIPDDNLAYPVLVNIGNGSGSGFLLHTGSEVYFVTAKHVLFDNNNIFRNTNVALVCQTRDINDDSTFNYLIDLTILQSNSHVYRHPTKDVCALKIGAVSNIVGISSRVDFVGGVSETQTGNSITVSVGFRAVKFINQILISNDVYLYGYPTSLGLKQSPQFDYNKPLLRKGIVANVYRSFGTIILDCPVYPGNSGGPVVQVIQEATGAHHYIIGVVSQFIPYSENWINQSNNLVHTEISNSGYSVAVAMDYVFEMLGIPINSVAVGPQPPNP